MVSYAEKKFLMTFVIVIILIPLTYAALNYYRRNTPINNGVVLNVCDFVQFKHKLAASFAEPRIFLFGLSNVLMGIRAQELSHSIGRTAANFGMNANMADGMLFEVLERELRPQDSVLISLPYWYFDREHAISGREAKVRDLVFSCPINGYRRLPLYFRLKFLFVQSPRQVLEGVFRRATSGWGMSPLRRTGLFDTKENGGMYNRFGDYENSLEAQRTPDTLNLVAQNPQPVEQFRLNMEGDGVRQLVRFLDSAREKNVDVLATWPTAYTNSDVDGAIIFDQVARLYEDLGVRIIGAPKDFLYPLNFYFNSNNHLTREGSMVHTKQLSRLLTPSMPKETVSQQ